MSVAPVAFGRLLSFIQLFFRHEARVLFHSSFLAIDQLLARGLPFPLGFRWRRWQLISIADGVVLRTRLYWSCPGLRTGVFFHLAGLDRDGHFPSFQGEVRVFCRSRFGEHLVICTQVRKDARLADRVGRSRPVWKSKFYGAFVLNRRVNLHAIDATPAR